MLTIDLELEQSLQAIAQREHSSPNELIKKLLREYLQQRQSPIAPDLHPSPPATTSPLTQSLAGLLANSHLNEQDYKQHLADKHL